MTGMKILLVDVKLKVRSRGLRCIRTESFIFCQQLSNYPVYWDAVMDLSFQGPIVFRSHDPLTVFEKWVVEIDSV